jgi:hypothetical protein
MNDNNRGEANGQPFLDLFLKLRVLIYNRPSSFSVTSDQRRV